MNALVFAAGLGTRLAHLTNNKPKALVEVNGKPMLLHAIEKLLNIGVKRIVINVHHHADQVISFVNGLRFTGVDLMISDEREMLLETGGALLKAAPLFLKDKPIILYNADVLTGANLKHMIDYHNVKGGMATLMVKKRDTSRYFLFDDSMRLSGWENVLKGDRMITRSEQNLTSYAFSGVHIVNQELLSLLGEVRKFSIVKGYLDISDQVSVFGWKDWDEYWFDMGSPEKLQVVNEFFKSDKNKG